MGDFFNGWKRKVGVVTLLMALALTGGWVRSLWEVDQLFYLSDRQTLHALHSSPSGLGWTAIQEQTARPVLGGEPVGMASLESFHAAGQSNAIYPFDWNHTHWSSQQSGFYWGTTFSETLPRPSVSVQEERIWIIRYSSIVIPLTLISLWLLLSKPRRSIQKKTAELIPEKMV